MTLRSIEEILRDLAREYPELWRAVQNACTEWRQRTPWTAYGDVSLLNAENSLLCRWAHGTSMMLGER